MELAYGLRFEINYPIPSDKSNYTLSLWPEKGSEIAEPEPKLLTFYTCASVSERGILAFVLTLLTFLAFLRHVKRKGGI